MKNHKRHLKVVGAFLGFLALIWIVSLFTTQTKQHESILGEVFDPQEIKDAEKKRGPTDPDEAAALRFFQTKDPATETVPLERLWAANRAAELSGQRPIANGLLSNVTERGPSTIGGRTRAVVWDPDVNNKVWAGGVAGGLWFTNDITADGTPWIKVNDFWDNLAISTMAFDPTTSGASRTYYVGTGEGFFNIDAVRGAGIFKSMDAGVSWDLLPSTENSSFHHVQKVVVTSTGIVLAATRDGILRSTNGGTSWTKVLGAGVGSPSAGLVNNAADLEIAPNGDIYAGMGLVFGGCDGVYKSTNGGVNWTKQSLPGACDYGRIEIATSPSSADTVYVATQSSNLANPAVNHIFKTTNGGTSWASPGGAPAAGAQAWYDLILSVDPNDAANIYLGVVTLWRSTNGAAGWSQINGTGIHVDHHAIEYKPGSSDEIAFGNDGGMYYTATAASKNGSAVPTVIDRNDDYNVTQYYGGDIHPGSGSNIMIGGTQDNSTHRFSSPGIGPVTSPSPLNCCDGGFTYIDQTNPDIVIGSIQNGRYYRSTDGGISFGSFGSPFLNAGGLFINPGDYDDTENVFYATRSTTQISRCHTIETTPSCSALTITGMNDEGSTYAVSPHSAAGTSTVYIGTQNGKLFRVETTLVAGVPTGQTITAINVGGLPTTNISSIAIGSSEQQLLITFSNYGVDSVWETLDGGTNWHDRDDNATLPDIPINWALYNPSNTQQVILATEAGIWGTTDITQATPTWVRAPDIPLVRVDQLQYRPSDGQVMIITHGRGVWTAQLDFAPPGPVTRFVSTTGNDTGNNCTNVANPCATVTHAVDQAVDGDTIDVDAGTYNEPGLIIDKDLDIQGAGVIVQ